MSIGALLLLLSAFLHASWNALAKSAKDKDSYLFLTMGLGAILSLASVLLFPPPTALDHPQVFWFAIASGLFEGLYLFALAKTLKSSSLGVSYAVMRGGAMIIVWLISLRFFGELATPTKYAGATFILGGILTMNAKSLFTRSQLSLNIWPFLCAVFIAGYHICYHQALERGAEPRSLFTLSIFVSLPLILYGVTAPRGRTLLKAFHAEPVSVLVTAVLSTLSFVIFLFGLRMSAPGFAISLRNSSIFFALVFSFILKENLSRPQMIGALWVAGGAILLSFS